MLARAAKANEQTVKTVALIVLGVLLLATASMAFLGHYIAAGATGAGAVVTGLYALIRRYSGEGSGRIDVQRLGKGPYRSIDCDPTPAVVEKLAKVVKQLRDVATDERWQVDWGRFNALDAKAMEAIQRKDYLETVRRQCHAISFMMEEIRQQPSRKKDPSDSSPRTNGNSSADCGAAPRAMPGRAYSRF